MRRRVKGVASARRRLKKLPGLLQERAAEMIVEHTAKVHRSGRENIQSMTRRRTGQLLRFYRRSVARATLVGRVGYLSARARRTVFYARFLHDGTRSIMPRPFHDNAVEEHIGDFPADALGALRSAIRTR